MVASLQTSRNLATPLLSLSVLKIRLFDHPTRSLITVVTYPVCRRKKLFGITIDTDCSARIYDHRCPPKDLAQFCIIRHVLVILKAKCLAMSVPSATMTVRNGTFCQSCRRTELPRCTMEIQPAFLTVLQSVITSSNVPRTSPKLDEQ